MSTQDRSRARLDAPNTGQSRQLCILYGTQLHIYAALSHKPRCRGRAAPVQRAPFTSPELFGVEVVEDASVGSVHDDGKSLHSSAGATMVRSQIWIRKGPRGPIAMHDASLSEFQGHEAGQASSIGLLHPLCVQ